MKTLIRLVTIGFAITVCVSLATTAMSEDGSRELRFPVQVKDLARSTDGGGGRAILQYDDGVAVYRDGAIGPNLLFIGNKVSAGLPPAGPYTVTGASVYMAGLYAGQFWMVFFQSPSHPTDPLGLIGWRAVLATATGWNSVLFATNVVSTGPFLVGVNNTAWGPCSGNTSLGTTCEGVALGPGTNGWGHNAMRVHLATSSATVGSAYATIPGQNALIRLTGPTVPVELMRVEVD